MPCAHPPHTQVPPHLELHSPPYSAASATEHRRIPFHSLFLLTFFNNIDIKKTSTAT